MMDAHDVVARILAHLVAAKLALEAGEFTECDGHIRTARAMQAEWALSDAAYDGLLATAVVIA
jgi:hypothetical protein